VHFRDLDNGFVEFPRC